MVAPRLVTVAKVSASVAVTVMVVPEVATLAIPLPFKVKAPEAPFKELQSVHDPF